MKNDEVYVSIDIEADGPIPGDNSMLSLGAVAFNNDGSVIDKFYINIDELIGAIQNPSTMEFWNRNKDAWNAMQKNKVAPDVAMKQFCDWLDSLSRSVVCIGYPAAYDFMFVYWYLMKFVGRCPFSHSALDIKTMAMIAMKTSYKKSTKRNMPNRWFDKSLKHTHIASDDALEQGKLFFAIRKELLGY